MPKEAKARLKINKLLEKAGWRFFDDENGRANIIVEGTTTLNAVDDFGDNFEKTAKGFIDFLLHDERGYPLVVLEAKNEDKEPLVGKEQARKYARSQNVRFVILSNGNLHYFWDLEQGNPELIVEFPTQESLAGRQSFKPDIKRLSAEIVEEDYIALSQNHQFKRDLRWLDESQRAAFLGDTELRILRPYQLKAIHTLQAAAKKGDSRFLFEMATGTGKTLVSAAIIKLFLQTGNANRVLFLVDRLELEDQAYKNFVAYLKHDYTTVIYKKSRDEWRNAEIVVSTIQSFTTDNKYLRLFSPTDFDLVISDESHRSISGNSRAVFEYFVGYKLGLTATPKDYLKNVDADELSATDPRAWEKRQLLDTYQTFGCASGDPTYRYSLVDGVNEGYLINPIVADARTEVTTELLSEQGYAVMVTNDEGEDEEMRFKQRDFEKKFFSERTNTIFCRTFLENALHDPISGEIGKTIVFCVSQKHATKVTQILNQMADKGFPGRYNSDFAVQVTSVIDDAQQFTIDFANDKLNGYTRFLEGYKTSKSRVCVTVGMMTTGYDCQNLLNLCMMRPIFSPTDFVQIKGRGTRKFTFKPPHGMDGEPVEKTAFKLFDFFANCEYFETEFDYDEILKLSAEVGELTGDGHYRVAEETAVYTPDPLLSFTETAVSAEGMKIDRQLFHKAAQPIRADSDIQHAVVNEQWARAEQIVRERYEDKPEDFFTLEKLRQAENLDRRLTWVEVIQRVFGLIDGFKGKDELLDEEVQKFVAIHKPDSRYVLPIRNFMRAYITDSSVRDIVESKEYGRFATNPKFSLADFKALNGWRDVVPSYVKDYVPMNTYL